MNNKISFVIPAYNCEATLAESINSIFLTNYSTGDEVIVVNDASTDNTRSIISILSKRYPVHVIDNKLNKGCPASRNIGIQASKNKYIFNLDSDDVLEKYSVIRLKEYRELMKADIAAFSQIYYFKDSINRVTHKWICPTGVYTLADFLNGPVVPGGNYLYSKSSWERVGGYWEYDKGLHEFWGYSLKQLASGSLFVTMPDSFYYHRYGSQSLFVRESSPEYSNMMATRMIRPFVNLLDTKDAKYILSSEGKKHWFSRLKNTPLRMKDGSVGRKGIVTHPLSWHFKKFINIVVLKIKGIFITK